MDSLPAEPLGLQLKKIKKQHLSTSGCCFGFSCSAKSKSVTSQTVARQAPLSMAFPRQEYWRGFAISLSRSSQPRDRTHVSCTGRQEPAEPPGKPLSFWYQSCNSRRSSQSCWGHNDHHSPCLCRHLWRTSWTRPLQYFPFLHQTVTGAGKIGQMT